MYMEDRMEHELSDCTRSDGLVPTQKLETYESPHPLRTTPADRIDSNTPSSYISQTWLALKYRKVPALGFLKEGH